MKVFVTTYGNMEIAECELVGAGFPITQDGAEKLAKQLFRGTRQSRINRKLDGCYRNFKSKP